MNAVADEPLTGREKVALVIVAGGLLWKGFRKDVHRYKMAPRGDLWGTPGEW